MSNIARWNIVAMSDANGAYVSVDDHRAEVERLTAERDAARAELLAQCASVADEVEATAEAEIAQRRLLITSWVANAMKAGGR